MYHYYIPNIKIIFYFHSCLCSNRFVSARGNLDSDGIACLIVILIAHENHTASPATLEMDRRRVCRAATRGIARQRSQSKNRWTMESARRMVGHAGYSEKLWSVSA